MPAHVRGPPRTPLWMGMRHGHVMRVCVGDRNEVFQGAGSPEDQGQLLSLQSSLLAQPL